MDRHLITRQIGIDAGHRVTHHGSKCRSMHGHRYEIYATCEGPLFEEGEQQGMVLDFGFLKEEMMSEIDADCDHAFIMWHDDEMCRDMFFPDRNPVWWKEVLREVDIHGGFSIYDSHSKQKYYIMASVPTAENLARHWYNRLAPRVKMRSREHANLRSVTVYETPNCSAVYAPEEI